MDILRILLNPAVKVVGVEDAVEVVALVLEDDCGEAAYGFSAVLQLR